MACDGCGVLPLGMRKRRPGGPSRAAVCPCVAGGIAGGVAQLRGGRGATPLRPFCRAGSHLGIFALMLTALQVQAGHVPSDSEVSFFVALSLLPLYLCAAMIMWVVVELAVDTVRQKRAEKARARWGEQRAKREALLRERQGLVRNAV